MHEVSVFKISSCWFCFTPKHLVVHLHQQPHNATGERVQWQGHWCDLEKRHVFDQSFGGFGCRGWSNHALPPSVFATWKIAGGHQSHAAWPKADLSTNRGPEEWVLFLLEGKFQGFSLVRGREGAESWSLLSTIILLLLLLLLFECWSLPSSVSQQCGRGFATPGMPSSVWREAKRNCNWQHPTFGHYLHRRSRRNWTEGWIEQYLLKVKNSSENYQG